MSQTLLTASTSAAGPRVSAESARAHAVAIALELIAARASGSTSVNLSEEMDKLSVYADQIQEALKVK